MTNQELLENGYFPKELPPPFQTKLFADKLIDIESDWKAVLILNNKAIKAKKEIFRERYWESKWVVHSLPKVGYSRRLLGIPNPYHQSILSKSISDRWAEIEVIFNKSTISNSKPVKDTTGKRALKSINTFGQFRKECLINSYDKIYEVRTDVSRYYGTIYTHIVPWIIHSKAVAKVDRKNLALLGNLLDKNLRESNSGQTLGIPIGPDTSLVVAEIIGCTLDEMIQKKFNSSAVKGFRYIDDYYIYCENQSDSEKVFKYVQSIFTEFQLDINEEKTKISKSPFPFETDWSIELGSFTFRKHPQSQQTDIERFVSVAFRYAKLNPKDSVLNFAITVLKGIPLFEESWKLYQSFVLKIAITEPVTLPTVAQILVSHKAKVEKLKVKSVVENIIKEHTPKGHHFEVSWALWICKEFEIKIPNNLAKLVFDSSDVVSILIALDLKKNGFINKPVSTSHLRIELTPESLMEDKWLLTYESILQGWIKSPKLNPISENEFFSLLKKHRVKFYDDTRKVTPYKLMSPIPKPKEIAETPKGEAPKVSVEKILSGSGGGNSDY
ncbi:RNA-directed DNA polymerase [Flavobacterium sp. SUN046]|uniref:RNA-directed DNA polymerase n=1 Tax=Flavobacterium sp. SUN046 TaxID=3002440 RepID=UPI002DB889EA|nr:RNA-directed DNA polymerase [Flavobacterium sp. SUN046]MEC4049651.1 RNA-directed DNA polymerase [Flavobacterium sp. SUN046]